MQNQTYVRWRVEVLGLYGGAVSYLVVARKAEDGWDVDVKGVGRTSADELSEIEDSARRLLTSYGYDDARDADLQLLLPDFEVDLAKMEQAIPTRDRPTVELVSGLILLVVVVGAVAFFVGRLF